MLDILIDITYLISAILFIFGIKKLSSVRTARQGNFYAGLAMFIAILVTLVDKSIIRFELIIAGIIIGALIGIIAAKVVKMTDMPQMVALFNGFGGAASALVAGSEYVRLGGSVEAFALVTGILGTLIGAVTFTGSIIAWGKLQGVVSQNSVTYPFQKTINAILAIAILIFGFLLVMSPVSSSFYWVILGLSLLLGILLVLPIGGADMPVVISLLNSYSGVAASMTGFVLMNKVLIVAGAIVGAAGLILTQIMCRAMNRSLANVAFGTFGEVEEGEGKKADQEYQGVKSCLSEEAAMILEGAQSVLVVPGYGMAVARAQHAIKEMTKILENKDVDVKFAIHPVAGRMPGHMNVLLAEAEVPYEQVVEMDAINHEFDQTDVALVIGANDVTNPAAREEKGSPIYGMPILNVDKARSVIVIKRSLSPGFAGIKNPLFEQENTVLLYDDAKKAIEEINKELQES